MELIEAARQALEALKKARDRIVEAGGSGWKLEAQRCVNAITALRTAIEDAEKREPVLCINPKVIDPETGKVRNGIGALTYSDSPCAGWSMPLYTTPPAAQRQWVGLTQSEELNMPLAHHWLTSVTLRDAYRLGALDAEAKLREKNGG